MNFMVLSWGLVKVDIEQTKLKDCFVITPSRYSDERGFFSETYNQQSLQSVGIDISFVQDNHSLSAEVGTLRGLHFQAPPFAQDKLVRVISGRVIDVAVDVRRGSPTYLQSVSVELSAKNGRQLLVPCGFLHGFVTLEENTEFLYKVSNYYSAQHDGSICFHDPSLAIDWGYRDTLILSEKDEKAPTFDSWVNPFLYGENC